MATSLTAETVYKLSRLSQMLRDGLSGSRIVLEDGAVRSCDAEILRRSTREIYNLITQYGLAPSEQNSLYSKTRSLDSLGKGQEPDYQFLQDLRMLFERVESAIRHEISADRNFKEIRPNEGTLDYVALISQGAKALFTNSGYYRLSKLVQQDLDEAAKSLSFGAPTACVMIGLRAVEGELRVLYNVITGKTFHEAWGKLTAELEELLKEQQEAGGKELLGYLSYLRSVRNKVDHPDKVFTTREAEQLLVHTIYSIEAIQDIASKQKKTTSS